MGLIKVDMVHLQTPEAILARSQYPPPGQPFALQRMIVTLRKVLTHRGTYFRRHQHSVSVPGRVQPSADNLFRNTSWIVRGPDRVTIGRVDQIPPGIHVRTEDFMRCGFIGTPSKLHGSKTDRGDQEPRISERAIANFCIHKVTLILRVEVKSSGLRVRSTIRSAKNPIGTGLVSFWLHVTN